MQSWAGGVESGAMCNTWGDPVDRCHTAETVAAHVVAKLCPNSLTDPGVLMELLDARIGLLVQENVSSSEILTGV